MESDRTVASRNVDGLLYPAAFRENVFCRCFLSGKGLGLGARTCATAAVEFQLTCASKTLSYPLMNRRSAPQSHSRHELTIQINGSFPFQVRRIAVDRIGPPVRTFRSGPRARRSREGAAALFFWFFGLLFRDFRRDNVGSTRVRVHGVVKTRDADW
jgi:hypothetical protein